MADSQGNPLVTEAANDLDGRSVFSTAAEILTKLLGVDGAGSGLDADLVDGQEASAFASSSHTHTESDITDLQSYLLSAADAGQALTISDDLDNVTSRGLYRWNAGSIPSNGPAGVDYGILLVESDGAQPWQFVLTRETTPVFSAFLRRRDAGTWTSWAEVGGLGGAGSSNTDITGDWDFQGDAQLSGLDIYNVKHPDFGATGNGSSDDSTEIQAALDAAATAGGGVVVLTNGTFNIGTTTLTLNDQNNVKIWISPSATLSYTGTAEAIKVTNSLRVVIKLDGFITCTNVSGSGITFEQTGTTGGVDDVTFCRVYGMGQIRNSAGRQTNKPALTAIASWGIKFVHSENSGVANYFNTVEDVRIDEFDAGVWLAPGANANKILNVQFETAWYQLLVESIENVILGGFYHKSDGTVSDQAECVHVGDSSESHNAIYNTIIGYAMEPGSNVNGIVVESGSVDNVFIGTENVADGNVFTETDNFHINHAAKTRPFTVMPGYSNNSAGQTKFTSWGANSQTTEADAHTPAPSNGIIRDLRVVMATAPGSGEALTVTLRKAGAGTSLQANVTGTNTTASDTSNEVKVNAGDLIDFSCVATNNGGYGGGNISIIAKFVPTP